MWGTPQDVQYAVKENAGRIYGINPDNLVLAMPMFPHTPLLDYSKFGNHGTNYGATWVRQNLNFDGVDDYTSTPLPDKLVYANPFTVIWRSINNAAETLKGVLNIQGATGAANQICTVYYASGYNGLLCGRAFNGSYSVKPAAAITKTNWNTFGITCIGGNNSLLLYTNGLVNSTVGGDSLGTYDANVISLGKGVTTSYYANCQVEFLHVFDIVLTANQMGLLNDRPWGLYEPVSRPVYYFYEVPSGGYPSPYYDRQFIGNTPVGGM